MTTKTENPEPLAVGQLVEITLTGRVVARSEGGDPTYVVQKGDRLFPCVAADLTPWVGDEGAGT